MTPTEELPPLPPSVPPSRGTSGGRSSFRHVWDKHSDAGLESTSEGRARTRTLRSNASRPTLRGRAFHSFSNSRSSNRHSGAQHSAGQRSVSFGRRTAGSITRSVSTFLGSDIIPDYIVYFLRGEDAREALARDQEAHGSTPIPETPETPESADFPRHSCRCETGHGQFLRSPVSSGQLPPRGEREKILRELGPQPGVARRLLAGWRGGVAVNLMLTLFILGVTIVCLAVASVKNRVVAGGASILDGTYQHVGDVSRGVNIVIEVFAMATVAGANYVFQILSSPTRAEVDAAHGQHKWLDVGIPSLRNLRFISFGRSLLAITTILIALSSQVIYNALMFTTHGVETPSNISQSSPASLDVDGPLLGVVAFLNLLFVLALFAALVLTLTRQSFAPLATLGDALSSFLIDEDPTTQDSCLMTRAAVKKGRWGQRESQYWYRQSSRWVWTPSAGRWAVWAATWIAPLVLALTMLGLSAKAAGAENPISTFGSITVVYELPSSAPRTGLALVAALPQLLFGVLYMSTNAIMSTMFLSHELSLYAKPNSRLPLRVSSGLAAGEQTTSLYLTLPRPWSWVVLFLTTAMCYMVSQGISLVTLGRAVDTPGIGLSPLPLIVLLALLVLLALVLVGLATRQADRRGTVESGEPAGNPLMLRGGACSAVLSARCHRVPHENGVERLALQWGVVREGVGMNAGHATFSARPVGDILVGKAYA